MMSRGSGRIVLVSSGMALTAYAGYGCYAPSKWALRGYAEVLRQELQPHGIIVQQAYPGNFQSPGFDEENKTKPVEAKAIEAGEQLQTSDDVARNLIDSVRRGHPHMSCGNFGINLLIRLTGGMSPRVNALADFVLSPLLILVSVIYRYMWDWEVGNAKHASLRHRQVQLASVNTARIVTAAGASASATSLLAPGATSGDSLNSSNSASIDNVNLHMSAVKTGGSSNAERT